MNRTSCYCLLLCALICACSSSDSSDTTTAGSSTADTTTVAHVAHPDSATAGPISDADSAAAVVTSYYNAISDRDYKRAWLLWSDSGRASNQTLEQFRQGFANTKTVTAVVGAPGRIEGAAGSRYIEIPVALRSTTGPDSISCYAGAYVLRKTVVDGATEAQMHWHIESGKIKRDKRC